MPISRAPSVYAHRFIGGVKREPQPKPFAAEGAEITEEDAEEDVEKAEGCGARFRCACRIAAREQNLKVYYLRNHNPLRGQKLSQSGQLLIAIC